jgi:hypothetical protein
MTYTYTINLLAFDLDHLLYLMVNIMTKNIKRRGRRQGNISYLIHNITTAYTVPLLRFWSFLSLSLSIFSEFFVKQKKSGNQNKMLLRETAMDWVKINNNFTSFSIQGLYLTYPDIQRLHTARSVTRYSKLNAPGRGEGTGLKTFAGPCDR